MDDYLPKPIRPDALAAILAKWTAPDSSAVQDPLRRELPTSGDSIRGRLRELEEDTAAGMVPKFVASFLNRTPGYLRELTETLDREDFEAFAQAAHSLRGAAGNLGASTMAGLCEELERLDSGGPPRSSANLLDRLHLEYDVVRRILEDAQAAAPCRGGNVVGADPS